ncbi:MAG TPA: adenylate/guanylate cyclase domain-containing protein [Thermoanaerobaculia bacterium]
MLRVRWTHQGRDETRNLQADEITIGRGNDNSIVLPDFSVSRRHAAIRKDADGWAVHDLMSTNGIQVNRVSVKHALLRSGDKIKIGVFELIVEDVAEPRATPLDSLPTPALGVAPVNATIMRSIADFSAAYGLDAKASGELRVDKRKTLEQAYSNKIFGIMTRLGRLLIKTESVDEVIGRVLDIAFEALPVDRGFILLQDEKSGEIVCELARTKDKVEFRPKGQVPVSKTIVEQVMRDRVALLTVDAQSDERVKMGESIRLHQIKAAMCVPLWSGEKIIGVMQVDSPFHSGSFNEQDLDLLTALANFAAVAVERLRNAKRAEFERAARGRLERYHSPGVIESIVQAEEGAIGGVKSAEVTVLFADLAGFTALSEQLSPEEVSAILEGYFTHAVEAIFEEGGTLDKFIGDCVMAFFGAPVPQADHAKRAVRAALKILDALDAWNQDRFDKEQPTLSMRIAINTGPVVVGDVGSNRRVDYTVLGNTVNVAARLEAYVGDATEITIGAETNRQLGDEFPTESLGQFQLKGLQRKIEAFRVVRGQPS